MTTKAVEQRAKEGGFRPINKAHAIVEVVWYIQFSGEFSKGALNKFLTLKGPLADDLPKFSEIQKFSFAITPQGAAAQHELGGLEFQRIKKDGSLGWMLRIQDNSISTHCLDYSTWTQSWQDASKYLHLALSNIEGPDLPVSLVGLKYIDRFLYEGPADQLDMSKLLQGNSELLFPKAFRAGPLWHCHTGWFETVAGCNSDCLNQLNIDAAYTTIAGERKHTTTIDHNALVRFSQGEDKLQAIVGDSPNDTSQLNTIMNALHDGNKKVLANLLTAEMSERIFLKAKEI
jgi:uncharacterized protein (TIGR04255 family)